MEVPWRLNFIFNTGFFEDTVGGVPGFDSAGDAHAIFAVFTPKLVRAFTLSVQSVTVLFEQSGHLLLNAAHAA